MRNNLTKIAHILFILVIGATITSCSSDDGGNPSGGGNTSGSNISDLPKQAYLVVEDYDGNIVKKDKYNGNGDITLRIYLDGSDKGQYDNKSAGQIQNGQVSLKLPEDMESKYLRSVKNTICNEESECNNISITPENLTGFTTGYLRVTIDENDCILFSNGSNGRDDVFFYYVSQSGKITGVDCVAGSTYNNSCKEYGNYDLNFSKGWNVYYRLWLNSNANRDDFSYTSDISKINDALEWWIICQEDDPDPGAYAKPIVGENRDNLM